MTPTFKALPQLITTPFGGVTQCKMTQEEIKELIKEMELRVWAFERYRDLHKEVDANHGYWDGKRSEAAFIVEKLTWILNNIN